MSNRTRPEDEGVTAAFDFGKEQPGDRTVTVTLLRNEYIPPIDTNGVTVHFEEGKFLAGDEVELPEANAKRLVRLGVAGVDQKARRFGAFMRARRQTVEDLYDDEDVSEHESFGPFSADHAPGNYPVVPRMTRAQEFGGRDGYEAQRVNGGLRVNLKERGFLMDPTPADIDHTGSSDRGGGPTSYAENRRAAQGDNPYGQMTGGPDRPVRGARRQPARPRAEQVANATQAEPDGDAEGDTE